MEMTKTAWQHIRRSPYQSFAAIVTMFLTFLVAGVFFLATYTSALILQYFESKPQIIVFFADNAGQTEIDALSGTLKATGKIAATRYVSKEEALEIYREQNKNDPLLLEMVTAEILPASLEISSVDPKFLEELEPIIKEADGVEEVVYQRDVVETLLSWTNAVRLVGGVLAGLLAFNSILMVTTVIALKIALKREEIEVLKLVGASPWYIRLPFILEGAYYGLFGAILAWIIIIVAVIWLQPVLVGFLGVVPAIGAVLASLTSATFLFTAAGFLGLLMLVGLLLGSIGSWLALGRYLKF